MPKNQYSVLRQWHMQRNAPWEPQKTTVTELRAKLKDDGYEVTARTIQRDLIELATIYPRCNEGATNPLAGVGNAMRRPYTYRG